MNCPMIFRSEVNMLKIFLRIFLLVLIPVLQVSAAEIPAKPSPFKLVNDYAGILGPAEETQLEHKLRAYMDSTSTQIAIVSVNTLEGDDLFDFSQRLATSWGIGQKGKNNGLLILVVKDDRKMRIHTGYGMEGFITDAQSKRITDNILRPNFKQGFYYSGLNEAVDYIISRGTGEYKAEPKKVGGKSVSKMIIPVIIMIIIFSIIGNNRNKKIRRYSKNNGVDLLTAAMLLGMANRGGGIFGGGGGGFGGGGGGFGGGSFGGGGFGGGGASGSW
jgi:uncharacterized protein